MITTEQDHAAPKTLPIDGARLRYRDSGGPGLPVLLTHGIGGSLELWNRQFEAVPEGLRLVAWDMPSHGLSDPAPGDTELSGIARRAWQLLDGLGIPRALLAGNSLGGAVSLRMAGQQPARAVGVALLNAAALSRQVMLPFRLMTLPVLGELMTKPSPQAVKQQVQALVHKPGAITPEVREAIERNVNRPGGAAHFLTLLRGMTTLGGQRPEVCEESMALLRQLTVPLLIVHGEHDAVLAPDHSRQAHAAAPGSELVMLKDCGHTPQLEQPAQINRLLAGLAQRC